MNAKIATKMTKTGGAPYWADKIFFQSDPFFKSNFRRSISERASFNSRCKVAVEADEIDGDGTALVATVAALGELETGTDKLSLEPPSTEELIEAIESVPLAGIVGATGDEMAPIDPFVPPPLADNKLLLHKHRKRYFWANSSGAWLNWVLNSEFASSNDANVGTTFIKNLSVFFESDDFETKIF